MKRNHFYYIITILLLFSFFTSCSNKDDELNTGLQNDCIKRTLGPNLVGLNLDFAYAMAVPYNSGKITSAQVDASIAGATGTFLENKSFHTNSSGVDIGIPIGEPSVTAGTKSEITFTKDTCAATLRYYYKIPEEARGKEVSFKFSTTAASGEKVSYDMGPYQISKMDIKLDIPIKDGDACYISIANMTAYNVTEAASNADKIDLVYLYRSIAGITFAHGLVSPAATDYLPGIVLPAGVNKSTLLKKVFNLRDRHLARAQYGVYIDDIDFEQMDFSGMPNYTINMKAEFGTWVETADKKYKAFVYFNSVDNSGKKAIISIKRYQIK